MAENAQDSLHTTTLLNIDKKLAPIDTQRLVFLCRDLIAHHDLDKIKTGMELFQALEKRKHINRYGDISLLLEILYAVKRVDLSEELAEKMKVPKFTDSITRAVSKYRYLLLDIAMTLSELEIEDVKFVAAELLGYAKENIQDIYHLLVLLENDGHISERSVRRLHEDLISHEVLKGKIQNYEDDIKEAVKESVKGKETETESRQVLHAEQDTVKETLKEDDKVSKPRHAERGSSRAPSSSGQEISPGLLRYSGLAINKTPLSESDRCQAKCKLEQLQQYYETSKDGPHKYAILNLIAVFHYRLGNAHEAEKVLKEVVDKDTTNVHAWQDLAFIFKRKHVHKEVSKCEERVKEQVVKIGGKDNEGNLVYARYLAGQALASAFDLHIETNRTDRLDYLTESDRLDKSIGLYERALVMGDGVVDASESSDWMYYLALDYIRRNNVRKIWADEKTYRATFERTFRYLEPSLKSDSIHRKSSAFGLLGNLFSQKPGCMAAIPKVPTSSDVVQYWGNPKACYLRALELNDKNWIAKNKLARLVFNEDRENDAMELVKQSLEINSGSTNHMARRVRGSIRRRKFNKLYRQGSKPDKTLLRLALADLKECISSNPYVLDMIHLAEVYHKLSWGEHGQPHDKGMLHDALHWCAEAEACQDGAMRPELHHRRAMILQDLEEHDGAVKCFMQAMDCDTTPSTPESIKNFLYMYIGMLRRFKTLEHPNHMLQQLVYWIEEGTKKYKKQDGRSKSKKSKKNVPIAEGGEDQSSVSENTSLKSAIKLNYFINQCPEEMVLVLNALATSKKRYQLELGQTCIKAFKATKVSYSLSPDELDQLQTDIEDEIKQCPVETLSIKMDALSIKSATSSPSMSFKSAASCFENGQTSATRGTDRISSEHLGDSKGRQRSDEGSNHHSSRGAAIQCVASGSHAQNPETANTRDVLTGSMAEVASQSSGSHPSLSGIPAASPGHMPLNYLLNSDTTAPPPDSPMSLAASANLGGTPHMTTPSSASYLFNVQVKRQCEGGSDKEVMTSIFSMTRDQFSYQDLMNKLDQVLVKTDLRPDEIGDTPQKAMHTQYEYDFYAVYDNKSTSACDFAFYHLRPQLEEGQSQLKGCFDIRDFMPGRSKFTNMGDALKNSAKVLFLITEGFFQNPTCAKALSMTLHQFSNKLVPVLLDHVILPPELGDLHHIDAKTTINWGLIRKHLEPPELEN